MKLIDQLDEFKYYTTGKRKRLGLFFCPFCKSEVKKIIGNGEKCKSCGCNQNPVKHGFSNTRLNDIWNSMRFRCSNKAVNQSKKDYYDRGIRVCDEWKNDFMSFHNWSLNNGYEKSLQIDRKNNDKGYNPENCRWVTQEINNQNSRQCKLTIEKAMEIIQLKNRGIKLKDIAEIYGVSISAISKIGRVSWTNLSEVI